MKDDSIYLNENLYANIDMLRRLQYQAKGFGFSARQPVNSVLAGKYVSKLRGRGLNFEELRQYRPGDDIRCMDWKVTRRTGKPHIKVYTEERERNVYLVIDQRSTMFFGSRGKMKSVVAAELSALIAWQISESGDRIGALIFNDHEALVVAAKRGRQHVVRLLKEVIVRNNRLKCGYIDKNPSDTFNNMLEKLINVSGHNALIIHIGDGCGWNELTTNKIKKLRQHNEVICFDVFDPLERELPKMSQMVVSDGQYQIQFSSTSDHTQAEYLRELTRQISLYQTTTVKYRIPLIAIDTINPVAQQLRKALGQVKS